MNFTLEERKIIYNAVKRYQMNNVHFESKSYEVCDNILKSLFDSVERPKDELSIQTSERD